MDSGVNTSATTNETDVVFSFRTPEHVAGHLLMFFVFCFPSLLLNSVNSVAVLFSPAISVAMKVSLINVTLSNIVYVIGVSWYLLGVVVIVIANIEGSVLNCQVAFVLYIWGSVLRFAALLTFGTVAFIIIRYKVDSVKTKILLPMCVIVGILTFLGSLLAFMPQYRVGVTPDGTRCGLSVARGMFTPIYVHVGIFCPLIGVLCLATVLILTINAYCYIRKNTITGNPVLKKALLKFSAFLLTLNVTNIFGFMIVGPLAAARRSSYVENVFYHYAPFLTFSALTVVNPLVMICVFKALRDMLGKCIKCGRRKTDSELKPPQKQVPVLANIHPDVPLSPPNVKSDEANALPRSPPSD